MFLNYGTTLIVLVLVGLSTTFAKWEATQWEPKSCTSKETCEKILDSSNSGVYTDCLPYDANKPGSKKVCAFVFSMYADMKQMVTSPSCDNCIVRTNAANLCQTLVTSRGPVVNHHGIKVCFAEHPTSYFCTVGDNVYVSCSVQAMACDKM